MKKKREPIHLTDEQRKWIMTLPESYRKVMTRAMSGISKAAAVKAKCLDCCNYERVEITKCTSTMNCPLYLYRPYQPKTS